MISLGGAFVSRHLLFLEGNTAVSEGYSKYAEFCCGSTLPPTLLS